MIISHMRDRASFIIYKADIITMAQLVLNFHTCKDCEVMISQLKDNSNWVNQIEKDRSIAEFLLHISKGHKSIFASLIKSIEA